GLDARLVDASDDLRDAPDREALLGRMLDNLHVHEIARLRAPPFAAGDQHLGPELVVRDDVVDASFRAEVADERGLASLEDVHDAALAPAGPVAAHADRDPIAVPQRPHLPRGQIDVRAAVVGTDEAVAVAVREDDARHEVEVAGQQEPAGPVPDQLAVADHRFQPVLERAAMRVGVDAEVRGQCLQRQRPLGTLHRRQDLVAAGDRMLVAALPVGAGRTVSSRHQDVRRAGKARGLMGHASYNETRPENSKPFDSVEGGHYIRAPSSTLPRWRNW